MNHEHQYGPGEGPEDGPDNGRCCGPGSPVDEAARMWQGAYFDAMRALQTDILKEKLRRKYGRELEKVAEDVADVLFKAWSGRFKAAAARSKAPDEFDELREKLGRRLGGKGKGR